MQHRDATGQVLTRSTNPAGLLDEVAPPGRRLRWWRLVTPRVDGHGTRFRPDGGDLSEHRANPVWLWGHGSSRNAIGDPPDPDNVIGHVVDYRQSAEALDVLVEYDTDPDPRALCERVWRKVERGLIRSCSVGAVPTETEEVDGVPTFTRWVLKEGSTVIIGSNPDAMVLTRDQAVAALDDADDAPPPAVADSPTATVPVVRDATSDVMTFGASGRPKLMRVVASVALSDASGRLLLGRRGDTGRWSLPGGHVEPGEPLRSAAERKLREKTGVTLAAGRLSPLGCGRSGEYEIHSFAAALGANDQAQVGDASGDPDQEFAELRWLARDEVVAMHAAGQLQAQRNVTLALLGWMPPDGILDLLPVSAAQVHPGTPGAAQVAAAQAAAPPLADHPAVGLRDGPAHHYEAVDHRAFRAERGGAWDAGAAVRRWARWSSSDGSGETGRVDWHKFAQCFVFFDSGSPGLTAGKLPHHDIRGGEPVTVWRGVVAAAAALQGARGGVSGLTPALLAAGRAHLSREYRAFGEVAPWDRVESVASRGDGGASGDAATAVVAAIPTTDADVLDLRATDRGGVRWDLAPGVRDALRRGLAWHRDGLGGDGLVQSTIHEAQQLEQGGAWWEDKARRARAWFARHGAAGHPTESSPGRPTPYGVAWALWGGDAGRDQVSDICATLDEGDARARESAAWALVSGGGAGGGAGESSEAGPGARGGAACLVRDLSAGGDLYALPGCRQISRSSQRGEVVPSGDATDSADQYGPDGAVLRSVASVGQAQSGSFTSKVYRGDPDMSLPKMTPDHRTMHRDLMAHHMDGAEHHMRMYEALPPEHSAMRSMHRDHAHALLQQCDEMHRAFVAHGPPDRDDAPDDGMVRAVPEGIKDEELKREFSRVYAAAGKLPRSLATVVREALGTDRAADVVAKVAVFRDDHDDLVRLRARATETAQAALVAQREDLINHWADPSRAVIHPARALEMRGYDPATYEPNKSLPTRAPWTLAQVDQYVRERAASGPLAPVVQTAPLVSVAPGGATPVPGVAPLNPAGAPPHAWQPSGRVRQGGFDPGQHVNFREAAAALNQQLTTTAGPGHVPGRRGLWDTAPAQRDESPGVSVDALAEVAGRIERGELRFGRPDPTQIAGSLDGGPAQMRQG